MKYKYKTFLLGILTFSFTALGVNAQSCPYSDTQDTIDYIFRDNNRCEGLRQGAAIGGSFEIVSFASRRLSSPYPSKMALEIPCLDCDRKAKPILTLRSLGKNYRLDNVEEQFITPTDSGFAFQWSSSVLKKAAISPDSLRAISWIQSGSEYVYLPVILGQPSGKYEFVLLSDRQTKIKAFKIFPYNDGQPIYSTSRNNWQRAGQLIFSWDGRNVSPGRYILLVEAELLQDSGTPEITSLEIIFEHNPDWLR